MSQATKPIVLIIVAVLVAASAGYYLSRGSSEPVSSGVAATLPVDPEGGRSKGPERAPLVLVEFGDYQCPTCAYFHPIVNELLQRYPTQLQLRFHHFPLIQIHPNSMAAAMAAEAAGEQGRFWQMHDLLFQNQQVWSRAANPESQFIAYAGELGLDINRFMRDMRSMVLQQRILADVVRAREARIDGVPGFFLNGEFIPLPQTVNEFAEIIEQHLPAK